MEKLDFGYIENVILDLMEKYNNVCIDGTAITSRLLYFGRFFPAVCKEKAFKPMLNLARFFAFRDYYFPSAMEKFFSLDLLIYSVRNKDNLELDLRWFSETDRNEILKFVRNKVYFSFMDFIDKDMLFDQNDFDIAKKYRSLRLKPNLLRKTTFEWNNRKYSLPLKDFEISVFFHKHGLDSIPSDVLESISKKDFIDGGAAMGESAIVMQEFGPRKIYSFEPDKKSFGILKETVAENKIDNVVPVNLGLHETKNSIVTTLDDFCRNNLCDIGMIKLDIEGAELEAIKGAENVIKTNKPLLLVSVYHTGKDFFEIPNLLKEWVPEYKMRFLNLNHYQPIYERILAAYI